jgi:hypothetical protein
MVIGDHERLVLDGRGRYRNSAVCDRTVVTAVGQSHV